MTTFVVTGLPGAGKTTISRALAGRFPRGVHVEGDVLSFEFVVSGLPKPFGDGADPEEWGRQMALRHRHIAMLARSFRDAEFVVCIDDFVVGRATVDHYVEHLGPVHLVVLAPPLDVVAARDAARHKQAFDDWSHAEVTMRAELGRIGLWLDTGDETPDETVDRILARRDEALVG